MTPDTLTTTLWPRLTRAASDPSDPVRTPTLATISADGTPSLRMVVLRDVRPDTRALVFHTDIRSAKWAELGVTPDASLLTWDPNARIQMRLSGHIARHGPGTPEASDAWADLPPHTRAAYASPPPGGPPEEPATQGGGAFGVLVFTGVTLDWLVLDRTGNRRMLLDLARNQASPVAP